MSVYGAHVCVRLCLVNVCVHAFMRVSALVLVFVHTEACACLLGAYVYVFVRVSLCMLALVYVSNVFVFGCVYVHVERMRLCMCGYSFMTARYP